jgi:hypothetical protein
MGLLGTSIGPGVAAAAPSRLFASQKKADLNGELIARFFEHLGQVSTPPTRPVTPLPVTASGFKVVQGLHVDNPLPAALMFAPKRD